MKDEYQLVIVGGGPAARGAVREAKRAGLTAAIVEKDAVGGTCLHRGCISAKTYLEAAALADRMEEAALGRPAVDPAALISRTAGIRARLQHSLEAYYNSAGVDILRGEGLILDGHHVRVGGKILRAGHILAATGSRPLRLSIPGSALPGVLTSDELFEMTTVPARLVVIGGGAVGVEMAEAFRAFGSRVTLLEAAPYLLPGFDRDCGRQIGRLLGWRGTEIRTGIRVREIRPVSGALRCLFEENGREAYAEGDVILMAVGRMPDVSCLSETVRAVIAPGGRILADEAGRTLLPGISAAGDCCGASLAHLAEAQGAAAAAAIAADSTDGRAIAGSGGAGLDAVPRCVYTRPEVMSLGLTSAEAADRGIAVDVRKSPVDTNGAAVIAGLDSGFIKLIADKATGRLLGAHMVSGRAVDMAPLLEMAVCRGLRAEDLDTVIYPHPSFCESIGEAAEKYRS